MDSAAGVGRLVGAQGAWAGRWDSSRTAIAGEVSLLENLDESMFAMALDGTGVANTSGIPGTASVCRWRIAGQASKDILPQWTEDLGAVLNALGKVSRQVDGSGRIMAVRKEGLRGHRPRGVLGCG